MTDDLILATERLRLRYFRGSDIAFAVSLWMDPEMTKHTGGPRDRTFLEGEFAKTADNPTLEEYDLWTVELTATGEPIGQAGFIPKEIEGESFVELSYFIDLAHQGQGYATEVATALVRHAFEDKKLKALVAIIGPQNERSIAVAERIGMRFWKEESRNGSRKIIYRIDAKRTSTGLERFGFVAWMEKTGAKNESSEFEIGRIASESKERYSLLSARGEFEAEITGNLRYGASDREDYPATGDWVRFKAFADGFAVIHSVLPRYSILKRRAAGGTGETQVIAANIDTALIVQSAEGDFNVNRLERYLAICGEAGIEPVAIISKTDLVDDTTLCDIKSVVSSKVGPDRTIFISSKTLAGFDSLRAAVFPGRTYCLLGSSGAGKSTLVNALSGRELMRTSELSESNEKGRHTTTHRELLLLDSGGIFIDNPGMREVGVMDSGAGIESAFPEISRLAEYCRFSDCTHSLEAGCAVLDALASGRVQQRVYDNYQKMRRENEYFTATKAQMHRKMRSFGKAAKIYQRDKKLGKF